MNDEKLFQKRHSLAHVLLMAIKHHFPYAKPTIGPVIENGFYYDFDFSGGPKLKEEDFPKIETTMREILSRNLAFTKETIDAGEALGLFKENKFKLELISDISSKDADITIYRTGEDFFDLCEGPHTQNTSEIAGDSFMLDKLAGAYWRGDEKREMLTRVYGLAFHTKEELDLFIFQREEAKKRDHKILGRELDLFTFSDLVGPGLPLWTPKGTLLRNLLDEKVWSLRYLRDYQKVEIPHITKKELYVTSGHWDKYKDDLFRITTRDGHEFAMKPMNCPHHTQIYARKLWSYKELPQRYANSTMCYRDEQTGELSGLSRVRAFTQDDAHVFCRMKDTKLEFLKIWDIVHEFYELFGFKLRVRISKHNPSEPEKYLGDKDRWAFAENMLTEIAQEKQADYFEGIGEAAFYGPKLDFMAKDAIGRDWQVATIQLDMNMPERFDLTCVNESGERERVVMIHAAIMGSIERFLSILIEHTGGNFPLWLSPMQVSVIPIADKHAEYAKNIANNLQKEGMRVELLDEKDSLGKKVRKVKDMKNPYWIVVGDKDIEASKLSLESRDRGQLGQITPEEAVAIFKAEIAEKK